MKNINKIFAVLMVMLVSFPAIAQFDNQGGQETSSTAKIKELNQRKAELERELAIAESKRNMSESGVAYDTQELLNIRQDSICLELRSELLEVELALKEQIPSKNINSLIEALNNKK